MPHTALINATVRWCRAKSLLPVAHDCERGCDCRVVRRARYSEGECFHCPWKGCQKLMSFRTDTFCENSNLPLEKIIRIIHMWSTVTPLNKMRKEVDVSCNTHVLVRTCRYIYNAILMYLYVQADTFIYNAPFAENSRRLVQLHLRCVCAIFPTEPCCDWWARHRGRD